MFFSDKPDLCTSLPALVQSQDEVNHEATSAIRYKALQGISKTKHKSCDSDVKDGDRLASNIIKPKDVSDVFHGSETYNLHSSNTDDLNTSKQSLSSLSYCESLKLHHRGQKDFSVVQRQDFPFSRLEHSRFTGTQWDKNRSESHQQESALIKDINKSALTCDVSKNQREEISEKFKGDRNSILYRRIDSNKETSQNATELKNPQCSLIDRILRSPLVSRTRLRIRSKSQESSEQHSRSKAFTAGDPIKCSTAGVGKLRDNAIDSSLPYSAIVTSSSNSCSYAYSPSVTTTASDTNVKICYSNPVLEQRNPVLEQQRQPGYVTNVSNKSCALKTSKELLKDVTFHSSAQSNIESVNSCSSPIKSIQKKVLKHPKSPFLRLKEKVFSPKSSRRKRHNSHADVSSSSSSHDTKQHGSIRSLNKKRSVTLSNQSLFFHNCYRRSFTDSSDSGSDDDGDNSSNCSSSLGGIKLKDCVSDSKTKSELYFVYCNSVAERLSNDNYRKVINRNVSVLNDKEQSSTQIVEEINRKNEVDILISNSNADQGVELDSTQNNDKILSLEGYIDNEDPLLNDNQILNECKHCKTPVLGSNHLCIINSGDRGDFIHNLNCDSVTDQTITRESICDKHTGNADGIFSENVNNRTSDIRDSVTSICSTNSNCSGRTEVYKYRIEGSDEVYEYLHFIEDCDKEDSIRRNVDNYYENEDGCSDNRINYIYDDNPVNENSIKGSLCDNSLSGTSRIDNVIDTTDNLCFNKEYAQVELDISLSGTSSNINESKSKDTNKSDSTFDKAVDSLTECKSSVLKDRGFIKDQRSNSNDNSTKVVTESKVVNGNGVTKHVNDCQIQKNEVVITESCESHSNQETSEPSNLNLASQAFGFKNLIGSLNFQDKSEAKSVKKSVDKITRVLSETESSLREDNNNYSDSSSQLCARCFEERASCEKKLSSIEKPLKAIKVYLEKLFNR